MSKIFMANQLEFKIALFQTPTMTQEVSLTRKLLIKFYLSQFNYWIILNISIEKN